MSMFRRLATIATAAEAARRYAKSNPDKAGRFVDQAAAFVDKQTKGRYRTQIDGAAKKAKGVAGIPAGPSHGAAPGYPPANGQTPGGYDSGPTQAYGTPGNPSAPPKSH